MNLILKPTGSHYGSDWGENDYVVLCNREVVGRVMLHPQASKEEPVVLDDYGTAAAAFTRKSRVLGHSESCNACLKGATVRPTLGQCSSHL